MSRWLILFLLFLMPSVWAVDPDTIAGLGARNIGSAAMSGRVSAIAAVKEEGRLTVYVGAASGGVWKSSNGGTTYKPIFDKHGSQSIGAIAIDPSHPKTVWVGTGESWTRNSVSIGDGIYRSTDGGDTWSCMGLKDSERIAAIVIDPHDGNTVYAAVPGKLWSDSPQRGLYKTTDGGQTWTQILQGPNLSTGCASISMDPQDSKVLYAGLWDFRRRGWTFRSGGESSTAPSGSGLFRSGDGGLTWTELTAGGLPPKPWGRVAVRVAPSNPRILYALIESTRSALFRSDDGGQTWQERDRSQWMVWRPFYFANLIIDPKDADRLYKPDLVLIMSADGGKSFSPISNAAHGDFHDVWVDPDDTQHLLAGDDGGMWYSHDQGSTWIKSNNLPISQFYHVSIDNDDPYHVLGGLQDNSVWIGDSAYPGGISNNRWENLYGGDGFWAFVDPADARYVYLESQGGDLARVNRRTHETRSIKPQQRYGEGKLRFNWNTPVHMSPNDRGTLYVGAQYLFRSRDHGQSWDRISPDLTTNDKAKQKQEESGGVTVDNSAAEMHTTIYSISESPRDGKIIWVGTDDGNLQKTADGGRTWTNLVSHVPGLPPASWVSWVEASRFNASTAYATFDRHTFGDMTPHVFRTTDGGRSWVSIVAPDSGVRGYAHVIKEDTVDSHLLFLGTECGLWISVDDGRSWAQYKGGDFPSVAVRDLVVQPRESDLVIATHGRGIWIIDDISPLRQLTPQVLGQDAVFMSLRPVQQRMSVWGGWADGSNSFTGPNPVDGAVITYYQKKRHIFGPMKLEVFDTAGKRVETLSANSRRGLTRVIWTMRVKAPRVPPAATAAFEASTGPRVLPGTYTVKMTRGKDVYTTHVVLTLDRRARFTVADRRLQFDSVMQVYRLLEDMAYEVENINSIRTALAAHPALAERADELRKKIVATKEGGAITGEERIREKAAHLYGDLSSYEGRPGDYQVARIGSLRHEFEDVSHQVDALLAEANKAVSPAVIHPLDRDKWDKTTRRSSPHPSPAAQDHDRD